MVCGHSVELGTTDLDDGRPAIGCVLNVTHEVIKNAKAVNLLTEFAGCLVAGGRSITSKQKNRCIERGMKDNKYQPPFDAVLSVTRVVVMCS